MERNNIIIKNAHTHNLKNIDIEIPKHKLVVFTGVSGSGKSSLLFDTVFIEAQRQLIETFSTFARARLPKLSRPDVDDIQNLSTAIVIDQKRMGNNLRSTVGTATEINTYLRLLFSRIGKPFIGPSFLLSFNHPEGMCPHCHGLGKQIQVDINMLLDKEKSIYEGAVIYPGMQVGSWFWRELTSIDLFDVHKKLKDFTEAELHKLLYTEPIQINKKHGTGTYSKTYEGIARKLEKSVKGKAEDEAPEEEKDAYKKYIVYSDCKSCNGSRLNERALSVKIKGISIAGLCAMELTEVLPFLSSIVDEIAIPITRKAQFLLEQLIEIGVGYLSLNRSVATLSGGESQRVKMARQLDCNLVDMLYVLDEPSIGLHPRDTVKLISILKRLRDNGNSVFVVEHDPDIIRAAEWIVDIGPKAGTDGGQLVYSGEPQGIFSTNSITGKFLLNDAKAIVRRKPATEFLVIENASVNNLKSVSVKIPVGVLTCITGVAGSGKSSLIHQVFLKQYPRAIVIDQSAIGKSSRANPATYTGIFDFIRKEFAQATGADASLFSFNSKGACPKCNGQGLLSFELHFLDAVKTICDECEGKRYKPDVLCLKYMNKTIAEVLDMSVDEAFQFFTSEKINKQLKVMHDVGLGYLKIGQSLSSLSGGESQRLKIASELHKVGNIYVMDEPTTGLHMSDIQRLYRIIRSLADKNNTVIVIEHNLDIIKYADWIIDMGPEGGRQGGEVLFQGIPEDIVNCVNSYTGKYLYKML
ncbi:MAG: daunorubicin resistance protein DrrC [Bacteroidetes bacterium HGW-Bacteroidetes-16]|jgi:excinuclease ABC A subunit|nr:MAG: daunorubicin resistance protein DrrC [Bacteroidetes bacterium HGW-Bacteroidetes-16]